MYENSQPLCLTPKILAFFSGYPLPFTGKVKIMRLSDTEAEAKNPF